MNEGRGSIRRTLPKESGKSSCARSRVDTSGVISTSRCQGASSRPLAIRDAELCSLRRFMATCIFPQPMTDQARYERRRWIALGLLSLAQFVVVLDASIVNVALPSIGRSLDFSQSNLAWVVNAYVLTFGGFLLLGGRMADLLGRRRVFIAGLLIVGVASLAAGFAATEGQLIAARAAQGLGAAIISPSALSIIMNTFSDGAERNKALGAWGAVAGAGGAAGVLLGGILTDGLGWEWVLWVNVPVALLAAALAPSLIAESRSTSTTRHFDAAGAVTVTAGLSILVYALVDATNAGWGSAQTLGDRKSVV